MFFIDSSNVDKSGRLAVEPVTFTLGIFKRHIRNLAESWRTIGYLENTHMSSDADITANQSATSKAQDYHAMLDLILTEIRELQGPQNGFEWTLDLNGKKYDVIFKIATQVIIGDCKGNDLLCGRYGSHSMKVKHLCRDCNVLTENGDDPNHICTMWTRNDICNKSKEEMNDISFHHINNAFNEIHFGARDLCITQVTPPEPLHGFKLGLCKYLFEGFEKQVAPKTMRLVNQTSRNLSRRLKLPCSENLPALNPFRTKGVSKCNTLSADEQYARVFVLYLTVLVPTVLKSMAEEERKAKIVTIGKNGREKIEFIKIGPLGMVRAKAWVQLISETVVLNSFLMSPEHSQEVIMPSISRQRGTSRRQNKSIAQLRMRKYLSLFKKVVDRNDGNGLCLPKFHQPLHYVDQIAKDGSLLNIDSGRCESMAKTNHTQPGRRTQMRQETFLRQLSHCYYCDMVVQEASRNYQLGYGTLKKNNIEKEETVCDVGGTDTITFGGSQYEMKYIEAENNNTSKIEVTWTTKTPVKSFDNLLIETVGKRLWLNNRAMVNGITTTSKLKGFTEMKSQGNLYRAHPSYREAHEWFDWVAINWEGIDDPVPALIKSFIDLTETQFRRSHYDEMLGNVIQSHDVELLRPMKYVIIQSALSADEDNKESGVYCISETNSKRFRLENKWRILPVESIIGPLTVIQDSVSQMDIGNVEYTVVNDKSTWYDGFLKNPQ